MKMDGRYQNGFLYEHHGAWYVRYYQRTSKEDGTCQLNLFLTSCGVEHHLC
jgi:hypothetical protein